MTGNYVSSPFGRIESTDMLDGVPTDRKKEIELEHALATVVVSELAALKKSDELIAL